MTIESDVRWDQFRMTERLRAILQPLRNGYPYDSYEGNPYLSAYQLAIAIRRQFPEVFEELGYPIGGEGSDVGYSLPDYIARFLPHRRDAADIETAFLHQQDLSSVQFTGGIISSTPYLTMFRLRLGQ